METPISSFVREQITLEVSALSRNISVGARGRFNSLEDKVWATRAVDRTLYCMGQTGAGAQILTHLLPGNESSEGKAVCPLDQQELSPDLDQTLL